MRLYSKNYKQRQKGQAILELAIFGSMLVMLLGVLISYGLRYYNQQEVTQESFRKALASAAVSMNKGTPLSVNHVVIKDEFIPDASNPFTGGSISPVMSSASVTRTFKLDDQIPDTEGELPQMEVNINGQTHTFKTSGFRVEEVLSGSIKKYEMIYGASNVDTGSKGIKKKPRGAAAEDPTSSKSIKIIDNCEGEIFSLETAVKQCRQIIDPAVCESECEKNKWPGDKGTNCANTCSAPMNTPWYCANAVRLEPAENHAYSFPILNGLFATAAKGEAFGLKPDYRKETRVSAQMQKQEDENALATRDNYGFEDQTTRTIVYKPYGDTSGVAANKDVTSTTTVNQEQEWRTEW